MGGGTHGCPCLRISRSLPRKRRFRAFSPRFEITFGHRKIDLLKNIANCNGASLPQIISDFDKIGSVRKLGLSAFQRCSFC